MSANVVRALPLPRHALLPLVVILASCQGVFGPERSVLQLEVAPQKVACVGEAQQECLQVREPGSSQWRYFYDEIEGFTFVAGSTYVLRVERITIHNPPADGSSARWRLLEVVSRTPVS